MNSSANELSRGDETARVEPKAMEVLLVLAAQAGEAVSRQALLDMVWPGVVVGDEALTQSIIKLRKALGDNPRAPTYIETIPKRGYRLIAPVVHGNVAQATVDVESAQRPEHAPVPGHAPAPPSVQAGRRALAIVALVSAAFVLVLGLATGIRAVETRLRPLPGAAGEALDPAAEEKAGIVSVTVLPFETIGGGAEQDYLARGISSDLMTDLSRVAGLRVIDLAGGAAAARAAQAARYIVSGSIERDATMLRINVRLANARTHEQIWSQRLERPYGDLFMIQNEITRSVVAQLPGTISDAERTQLAKHYTNSVAAYENFLRAKALFLVHRPEENDQARIYYAKALEEDPQFARAYAGLAMTYAMDYRYQRSGEPAAALARADELAETARQIDPDMPEVYWALGFIRVQARRYGQAIEALRKAIQMNPSYSDAYALLGGIYTYTGHAAFSIPLVRTALRLNPDGNYLYFLLLGRAYLFENDLEQALINLHEAATRNPEDVETHIYLAATLVAVGDPAAAEREADEVRTEEPAFSMRAWLKTYPLTSGPYQQRLLQLASRVLN
ncbi:MAG TPA: winged helix-turn-helix domain-containing protein [Burkholderiaceae bacterium]|nr:winged helix-turn-helix domain-containing protein [Burkholderiaceae bacterium]